MEPGGIDTAESPCYQSRSMDTWNTSHTLLRRACDSTDEDAWADFVAHYQGFIFHVLRQMNIPQAHIEDLAQDILLNLWEKLPRYRQDKARFRTWLGTVVRNAALNHIKKERLRLQRDERFSESQGRMHGGIPATEPELDRIIEREWEVYIVNLAMDRAREAFQGKAIEAFELDRQGLGLEAIAERLGITKASANTLRNRVKNCLLKEIRLLLEERGLQ